MRQGHGFRSRYAAGCRCDECTAANRAYMMAWRRERGVQPFQPTVLVHGTYVGYQKRGCRCARCREANTVYFRERRRRRRATENAHIDGSPDGD